MKNSKPKILLTSVIQPFGKRHGDAFSTTPQALLQLMWAQDIFRIEDPAYHWGLDVIANNIDAPTVVLHYPTMRELIRELKKGYDYVGISFNPPTFHKLKKMVPVIRKYAPGAKIVLGGHGTALRDDELEGYYDLLCREEGIAYFRELLGEPLEGRQFKTPPIVFKSLPLLAAAAGQDRADLRRRGLRQRLRLLHDLGLLQAAAPPLPAQRPRDPRGHRLGQARKTPRWSPS